MIHVEAAHPIEEGKSTYELQIYITHKLFHTLYNDNTFHIIGRLWRKTGVWHSRGKQRLGRQTKGELITINEIITR